MKISKKVRYGLRILLDLAVHADGAPRMLKDVADSQQITEPYVRKLLFELLHGNLVKSVRGIRGGYILARKPVEISVLDVIRAMGGPVLLVDCLKSSAACAKTNTCATRDAWSLINSELTDCMSGITLQAIVDNHRIKCSNQAHCDHFSIEKEC